MDDTAKRLTELETRMANVTTTKQIAILEYRTAKGANPVNPSPSAWRTYPINTLVFDGIGVVCNGSGRFSLPDGNYLVRAHIPARDIDTIRAALFRYDDNSYLAYGNAGDCNGSYGVSASALLTAIISLTRQSALELRYYCTSSGTTGFGAAQSSAPYETWGSIQFERI